MKKILIGTSALVAAIAVSGAAQAADPIKLSISGFGSALVSFVDQDIQDAAGAGEFNSVDIKGNNEIHFSGATTLDNGLTVSVTYEMEAGGRDMGDVSDEWNISVGGSFGTIVMGADDSALEAIAMGAPRVGGNLFDGLSGGGVISGAYVVAPAGFDPLGGQTDTYIATNGDSESISYISPSFAGFTVGASYVPDITGDDNPDWVSGATANDAYGVGAMYTGEFGGVEVGVNGGYLWADVDNAIAPGSTDGWNEWQAGMSLAYNGFGFGGSYRHIDSGINDLEQDVWEIGVGYSVDAYGVSLSYLNLTKDEIGMEDDEASVYELAGQYTMGPGVWLVGGLSYVDFDTAGTGAGSDNDGIVVETGLEIAF